MKNKIVLLLLALSIACISIAEDQLPPDDPSLKVTKRGEVVASFEGEYNHTTEAFSLKKGPATFSFTHELDKKDPDVDPKKAKFSVLLLNDQKEYVELLIGTIGKFDGAKSTKIEKDGAYYLKITAAGKWTIRIEQ